MTSEHDYTSRTWGHDYTIQCVIDGGKELRAAGWGYGIEEGDYIILPNGRKTTRYQVSEVRYTPDPPDMWFATLTFAPR